MQHGGNDRQEGEAFIRCGTCHIPIDHLLEVISTHSILMQLTLPPQAGLGEQRKKRKKRGRVSPRHPIVARHTHHVVNGSLCYLSLYGATTTTTTTSTTTTSSNSPLFQFPNSGLEHSLLILELGNSRVTIRDIILQLGNQLKAPHPLGLEVIGQLFHHHKLVGKHVGTIRAITCSRLE